MAWNQPPAPITPIDEYEVRTGMAADPLGRDLDHEAERADRLREMGPFNEAWAWTEIYGDHRRSGHVVPIGTKRPPIDANEEAA